MYGTIARLQLRPGAEKQLREAMAAMRTRQVPGFVASYLYRMDEDPNVLMLAVLFADRETYTRNADDPAQDREYRLLRACLESDPEWHDGEVAWSSTHLVVDDPGHRAKMLDRGSRRRHTAPGGGGRSDPSGPPSRAILHRATRVHRSGIGAPGGPGHSRREGG